MRSWRLVSALAAFLFAQGGFAEPMVEASSGTLRKTVHLHCEARSQPGEQFELIVDGMLALKGERSFDPGRTGRSDGSPESFALDGKNVLSVTLKELSTGIKAFEGDVQAANANTTGTVELTWKYDAASEKFHLIGDGATFRLIGQGSPINALLFLRSTDYRDQRISINFERLGRTDLKQVPHFYPKCHAIVVR